MSDETLRRWLFEYEYQGETYGIEVYDDTYEAALGRVRRMSSATCRGEIKGKVSVPRWFSSLMLFLRREEPTP